MKRFLALFISLCLILTLFAACGEKKDVASDAGVQKTQTEVKQQEPEEKATLKVFFSSFDYNTFLKPLIDGFTTKYPNIKLQFDTPGATAYETVLKAKIATGEIPDLYTIWPGGLMADYAKQGHLLDITGQPYADRLTDLVKDEYTYKGRLYGVGTNATAEGVFYNRKIFSDLKIEQPKDWDEFLTACETIKKANITPLASGFKDDWVPIRFVNAAWATLVFGRISDFDAQMLAGKIKFTDKNVLEVYQKFVTLIDKGYFDKTPLSTDYNLANTMLAQGKAAMLIQGMWALADLRAANKDMDLGFMPLPVNNKGEEILGNWHVEVGMGASSKTKYPGAVNKFFDHFLTDDVYKEFLQNKKVYPVTKGLEVQVDPSTDPFLKDYVDTGKVRTWSHEIWPNAMTNNWKKKLQELVIKNITPEQMCDWMDQEYVKSENLYK